MLESKLLETLKHLPGKEQSKFEEFLISPYFSKSEELLAFYRHIKIYSPSFDDPSLGKEAVFVALYPNTAYKEKKVTSLMSSLLELLERFIALRSYERDKGQQLLYLLKEFCDTSLQKQYNHASKQFHDYLERDTGSREEYFYRLFMYNYVELENNAKFSKRGYDEKLQESIDNLDNFYLAEKLRLSCEIFNRQSILAAEYKSALLDQILEYLKEKPAKNKPTIQIYNCIAHLLKDEDGENYFQEYKGLLARYVDRFSDDEKRQMYLYGINYCIRQVNRGQENFLIELFFMFETLMDKNLLVIDGIIPPWRFKNIVTLSLKLGKYDWTANFIDEYKEFLPEEHKENAIQYNMANLYYEQKNYDKSLEYLRDVEFTDVFLNIGSKVLMVKIYYELGEFAVLFNLLESFRMFLQRNKVISEKQKEVTMNFIKFTKKLMKLQEGENNQLEALKDSIVETKSVRYADWLLVQIEEKMSVTP